MIKITDFNTIKKDLEIIANEIKNTTEKVKPEQFIARLVICYTEQEKEKFSVEYTKLMQIAEQLNKLTISYKAKDNKYFYLLKDTDFENISDFRQLKIMFNGGSTISTEPNRQGLKDYKILTINLKNYNKYEKFLNIAINLLKK